MTIYIRYPKIGNVTGPSSSTPGDIAVFADSSGTVLADGGVSVGGITLQFAYNNATSAVPQITYDFNYDFQIIGSDRNDATASSNVVITAASNSGGGDGGGLLLSGGGVTKDFSTGGLLQCFSGDGNTKDTTSGAAYFGSGAANSATGSTSGDTFLGSGAGYILSGTVNLRTGPTISGPSGPLNIYTGAPTGGPSGAITMYTSDATGDDAGSITIQPGASDSVGGTLNLNTKDSSGDAGAINIVGGLGAGSARGLVSIAAPLRVYSNSSIPTFQINQSGQVCVTSLSFGAPNSSQLLLVDDRISNAASPARAAFSASATVVTSASWSGSNIRGFFGGAVYVADQHFNNGSVLIGLEGGVTTIVGASKTVQGAIGLFGTLRLSGSSTTTTGTCVASYVVVGSGHTCSTLKHFSVPNNSYTGTVTTQYGFFMPALTGAGTNYELFMDTSARTYYRASTQYIYSSAASTLDISSNTTLNLAIGGATKTALTSTALSQTGDFKLTTAGNGHYVKEGTNATMGTAVLVAGTVVVNTTKVTANSRIFLTANTAGGTLGAVYISARTAGTSFTITSLNALDTSTIAWLIMEPA